MSTPLGVTERHRKQQLDIVSRVLRLLLPITASLQAAFRPEDRTITPADWLDLSLQTILSGRDESLAAGYDYYRRVSYAATGSTDVPVLDDIRTEPNIEQLRVSLLVTGPGVYRRKLTEGATEQQALRAAQSAVMGAATRHILDGSRSLTNQAVRADKKARGWIRVTDGDPCAFCAMLATRGFAVLRKETGAGLYTSEETAGARANTRFIGDGSFKFHDHCGCTVMPVFGDNFELPANAEKWDKLYHDSTASYTGEDKLKAWRRAYRQFQKETKSADTDEPTSS